MNQTGRRAGTEWFAAPPSRLPVGRSMAWWNIDSDNSVAFFAAKHFMITDVHGQFNRLRGSIFFEMDELLSTTMNVEIEVGTLYTGIDKRDKHLLSSDFFDVSRFPIMAFKSMAVQPLVWNSFKLAGSLSIRGISREIILDGEFFGRIKSLEKFGREISMGFALSGLLHQEDFGFTWNVPMENNGMVVGREIGLWANLAADLVEE
jgi:polyisoprenoid-binding protein YceI